MITIDIKIPSHYPVNRESIKKGVETVLKQRTMENVEVSILFVGDRQMKTLNTQYRKIEDTTDVLSFPQHDPSQPMHQFVTPPDKTIYLGDIIVSYPQAIKEAAQDSVMVDDKILQLVLHGLDHLMGIHHPE